MTLFDAIILAIVEGITEFLPISSTGHLVLTSHLLGITHTNFVGSFEIIIQLGAILAIVLLYWKKVIVNFALWKKLLLAFLPSAIVGFTLYKVIKHILLGNIYITLAALFLGGIVLLVIEKYLTRKEQIQEVTDITYKQAFIIGCFQSFSIIPGVSRAAATIIGGLVQGASRKAAVEFSFLLAVPTMAAASGLDLIESNLSFTPNELLLLSVGFIGSFLVALAAVKFLLSFIQSKTFAAFGIYRIVFSVLYFLLFV